MKTSYSRHELYALGEPLGNGATRKEGGRVIYGGGGGQPAYTESKVTNSNIPEYAQPYVENMLGAAQKQVYGADGTSFQPYKAYGGTYDAQGNQTSYDPSKGIAGFQPMQTQAQAGIQDMQVPGQFAQGAQGAMDVAGQANVGGFQNQVGGYMSPYMQNVVDIQKREAGRQSAIQGTQQQAQATQAGGFGGSRDAIMRAERERNLGQQMGDIQAQGSQAAFQQAQQQYNADRNRMGQSYATLGSQGQNLYGQTTGNINMQNLYGTQQQQQGQNMLDVSQQNYAAEQNYPYKQIGFMADIINRNPVSNLGSTIVQPPPSLISQLAGAGTAAYGMYQMGQGQGQPRKAEGGSIHEQRGAGLNDLAMYQMSRG
jgi:hypothetical protein